MDYSKNLKAFLTTFPIKEFNGQQMFLAISAHMAIGSISTEIDIAMVRDFWPKSLFKVAYNSGFYDRAQSNGWVNPVKKGAFVITDKGIDDLAELEPVSENVGLSSSHGNLCIFDKKSTHSFDKFIRTLFANAKSYVLIADSWVDDTIFDNVLDTIPKILKINLIYGQKRGAFDSRVARFVKEYPNFVVKKYDDLHDRFLIIDGIGYIVGPSIKDAATNSPALVVALDKKDSILLTSFFQTLWLKAK